MSPHNNNEPQLSISVGSALIGKREALAGCCFLYFSENHVGTRHHLLQLNCPYRQIQLCNPILSYHCWDVGGHA
eukprot:1103808-Pelagomonas_calceolata.AAC.1